MKRIVCTYPCVGAKTRKEAEELMQNFVGHILNIKSASEIYPSIPNSAPFVLFADIQDLED